MRRARRNLEDMELLNYMPDYSKKSSSFIAAKIRKIQKEGIRGKNVGKKQRVAVALSYARKAGYKVPKKK